jgi:hypothetical protein
MGEEHYLRDQAASAVEEALRHSTVGVVGGSDKNKWKGLGTGTFVEWNGYQLVLTAEHVIRGTAAADLRFFLPVQDVPGSVDRKTLLDLRGAPTSQLFPFSELPIRGVVVDTNLDLAAIDITNSVPETESSGSFQLNPVAEHRTRERVSCRADIHTTSCGRRSTARRSPSCLCTGRASLHRAAGSRSSTLLFISLPASRAK